jgi:hypothetical protein
MKFSPILKKFQVYPYFEIICMGYPFWSRQLRWRDFYTCRATACGATGAPTLGRLALTGAGVAEHGARRVVPLHAARRTVTACVAFLLDP